MGNFLKEVGLELSFVGLVGFKTIWRRESGAKKKRYSCGETDFPGAEKLLVLMG